MKSHKTKVSDNTHVELLGIDITSLSEATFMFSGDFINKNVIGNLASWIDITFDTKSRVLGSGANSPHEYRILFHYRFNTKNPREEEILKEVKDKLVDIYARARSNDFNARWAPERVQMEMDSLV